MKPAWVFKRAWLRVSGREAHGLYRELVATKETLATRDGELAATRSELATRAGELAATRNSVEVLTSQLNHSRHSRETRIHPYVSEALAIASKNSRTTSTYKSQATTNDLEGTFSKYGSDKESRHSYALTYSEILQGSHNPHILEVGLGSLNGFPYGGLPPGGSIKAWREAYPTSLIVGADIDEEAVASISEIGMVVDQTSDESLEAFVEKIQEYAPFDLIIDDGFHDPHANLRTLLKVFPLISDTGAYVIEDIHNSLVDFWKVIGSTHDSHLEIRDLSAERPDTDDNILLIFRKKRMAF
jgi:hypothetical protein